MSAGLFYDLAQLAVKSLSQREEFPIVITQVNSWVLSKGAWWFRPYVQPFEIL